MLQKGYSKGEIMYVHTAAGHAWIDLSKVTALHETTDTTSSYSPFMVFLDGGAVFPLTEDSYRELEGRVVQGDMKDDSKTDESMLSDIKFLLSFVPDWAKEVHEGVDATFYGTLSYEGDMDVKKRVDEIKGRVVQK